MFMCHSDLLNTGEKEGTSFGSLGYSNRITVLPVKSASGCSQWGVVDSLSLLNYINLVTPLFSSTNSCVDDLMDEDEKDRAKRY